MKKLGTVVLAIAFFAFAAFFESFVYGGTIRKAAWSWVSEAFSGNTIAGTIREVEQNSGYVIFYISKNRPADGVGVPMAAFKSDLLIAAAIGDDRAVLATLLTLGEKYRGERIRVKGKKVKQADGSSLIFVSSMRDITFVEE